MTRYRRAAGILAPSPIADSKPVTESEVPTAPKLGAGAHVPGDSDTASTEAEMPAAVVPAMPARSRSYCEGHRPFISAETAKGRNATAIYQDLVEHHGYEGGYDAVKRFVRSLEPRSQKISCRFETFPGQEAQVDYGEGAPTLDVRRGKYRKPRLFVLSLGSSGHAFLATARSS